MRELYQLKNAKFDGSHLNEIVLGIGKKRNNGASEEDCIQYGIEVMKNSFGIAASTCKAIVEWVVTFTKADEGDTCINIPSALFDCFLEWKISEVLKKKRTHERYNHLRNLHDPTNMNKLQTLIGTFIDLPVFGYEESDLVPNEFDPKAKYLLTQQRFEILKEVVDGSRGMVLSGPRGVSKSYTLYLIAAYAFVNSIPLLFVPRCLSWVQAYYTSKVVGAEDYLCRLFLELNSDILSPIQIMELQKTRGLVSHLSTHFGNKKKFIFYLFGEHNELFRPNNG